MIHFVSTGTGHLQDTNDPSDTGYQNLLVLGMASFLVPSKGQARMAVIRCAQLDGLSFSSSSGEASGWSPGTGAFTRAAGG